MIKNIGKGSIGTVKLATHKSSNKICALKFISYSQWKNISFGIKISKKLRHRNLIRTYKYFFDRYHSRKHIILVMEYFAGNNLYDLIVSDPDFYKNYDIIDIIKQLVKGIHYIHRKKLIHQDIKLENILINKEGKVKIVDYDFLTKEKPFRSSKCGTPYYVSPEVILGKAITSSTDLWSLGICIYVILVGDFPYNSDNEFDLYHDVVHGEIDYNNIPENYKTLVRGLLRKNPENRMSYRQLNKVLKELSKY